ncbi:MAG: DUF1343 domain-containing protein [Desulfobacterales bacterium]|nr:DUF1343 domain-containing protein [Desulfobacterales bacterium]
MNKILTGLDRIREKPWKKLKGYRLGLLANQASLDSSLNTAKDVIGHVFPGQLKALFGPQHGYGGEDQDNMVETRHAVDKELNIPVYSLYSETREPRPNMLEMIDLLLIDLRDVGTRVYTFASTMLSCLKAAAGAGKKVLVLDRPNPLGGEIVEGNLLQPEMYSFVGPYKIPMRHGMTMGEMALMFNDRFGLNCGLEIIRIQGWRRDMLWDETGLKWLMPSTNMPSPNTAAVYPGQVTWEGTNLSEGRGTCRPFEIFGAPYLDTGAVKKSLGPEAQKGCYLQEYSFRPTFNKWQGDLCRGFMIHVLDPRKFQPYFFALSMLKAVMEIHTRDFEWKAPPYEYEYNRMPIDLILGHISIRKELESGISPLSIKEKWLPDLDSFIQWRKPYLLYS